MIRAIRRLVGLLVRHHVFGSLLIVLAASMVISRQIADRASFADGELRHDVMDRWGAPIDQAAPSVRAVASGTVFSELEALPLDSQEVEVDARMNYRKRGLVYFSGFEFTFRGQYTLRNRREHDIDIVFVFPIDLAKNKILLSGLEFSVDGRPAPIDLADGSDKLVWTGRVAPGRQAAFAIRYQGRGLDSFTYRLDPKLPARGLRLAVHIAGGVEFDYAPGVVSAATTRVAADRVSLEWNYASLESGVPLGVILPSERSFDAIVATMLRRSWATFLLFLAGTTALAAYHRRLLSIDQAYLLAAAYGFYFVLLAYLAAFVNFYVAFALSNLVVGALLALNLLRALDAGAIGPIVGLVGACLTVPSLAIVLQGYTGLIYTLEILAGLAALTAFAARPWFRGMLDVLLAPPAPVGVAR